jgi:hypothetical protein
MTEHLEFHLRGAETTQNEFDRRIHIAAVQARLMYLSAQETARYIAICNLHRQSIDSRRRGE